MIDYSLKAHVMNNTNLVELQRKVSRSKYAFYMLHNFGVVIKSDFDFFQALAIEEEFSRKFPDLWHEAEKINHAYYQRVRRLKERINFMLSYGKCVFGTLTFTNEVLDSTSEETRKKYILRYLSSFNTPYIANIDYGKKNEREHYHFVILKEFIPRLWDYGRQNYESIIVNGSSSVCLAKYVSKLTNHAIKDTNRRCCVIYSRNFPKISKYDSIIPVKHCFSYMGKKYYY